MASDWVAIFERERGRYEDGRSRLPRLEDPDDRQRQLTRMGNAAYAAGLAAYAAGEPSSAQIWLGRAADRWRESWDDAPPGSWGRPIGAIKARILGADADGAADGQRQQPPEAGASHGADVPPEELDHRGLPGGNDHQ